MSVLPNRLVLQYLYDLGVVVPPDRVGPGNWPGVAGKIPPDGNRYVGVMNTGARVQARIQRTGEYLRHPSFQVTVRAEDDAAAGGLCEDIVSMLSKMGSRADDGWGWLPVFVDGEAWAMQSASLLTAPFPLGLERDHDLYLYSINAALTARRITPGNVNYLYPLGGYG